MDLPLLCTLTSCLVQFSNVLQGLSPEREGVKPGRGGRSAGMSWPNDDGRVTAPFVRKRWETDVAFGRTTEKPAASQLARHLCLDVVLALDRQRPGGSRHCNAKLLHAVTPASSGSVSLCGWDYLGLRCCEGPPSSTLAELWGCCCHVTHTHHRRLVPNPCGLQPGTFFNASCWLFVRLT